MMKVNDVTRLR